MDKKGCFLTLEFGMSREEFEVVREKVDSPFIRCRGGVYLTSSVGTFLGSATADATRKEPPKRRKL